MAMLTVVVKTEYIKLDALLKFAGLCDTGGQAKEMILAGQVYLNGEVCTVRGRKCRPGDMVYFNGTHIALTWR